MFETLFGFGVASSIPIIAGGILTVLGAILGSKAILYLGIMLFAVFFLLPLNVSPLIWAALIILFIFFLSKGRI